MKKLLTAIGRPFYYALAYSLIGLLYIFYFLGHLATTLPTQAIRLAKQFSQKTKTQKRKLQKAKRIKPVSRIRLPKLSLPRIKLPKISLPKLALPKISLPQINLPKIVLPQIKRLRVKFPQISLPQFKISKKIKRFTPDLKALIFLGVLFLVFWETILKDLPSPNELTSRNQQVSTKIYDRNGILLYTIYKDENRSPVPLAQIPQSVRLATLAAEDAEFYSHPGFSIKGIVRSLVFNASQGELQGGSTITQQLVKNVLLSPERTLSRKIKELILSIETELTYSKDQILEMYLNEVSYGGTTYGIGEASQQYFGKKVGDLSLAEAAYLAGLPRSPTKYSPYGSDPQAGLDRQHEILKLMRINKFITKDQEDQALKEELTFLPNKSDIKAPHFVMYVRQELVDKYGEEVVEKGGLEVTTTLDYDIQKMAEDVVKRQVAKAAGLRVGNGAAVVLNPKTGEILAMVGSKDYFDAKADGQVNVTTSLRQPGSSIKVVNYLYALMHGYTAASIISDTPVTFIAPGQAPYTPKNYDNLFRGKVTLRTALAESRNIPAVRVLASYGVDKMIDLGTQMGITSWTDPSRYGISLTLGGGEVRLVDLARVFATIADYGGRPEQISIIRVKNYKGEILEENKCAIDTDCNQNVADPRAAFILIDILKDNAARAPEFGLYSSLVIPGHPEVAVKTGTSNDLKDNLTVGFTQKYLTAVWVGNNDGSSMSRIASGITGAAPIWNEIMSHLLANEPVTAWQPPEGVARVSCGGRSEWFIDGTGGNYCSLLAELQKAKEATPSASPKPDILNTGASTVR